MVGLCSPVLQNRRTACSLKLLCALLTMCKACAVSLMCDEASRLIYKFKCGVEGSAAVDRQLDHVRCPICCIVSLLSLPSQTS